MRKKRIVIFDLWETLVFGTKDSAVSIFYREMTGEEMDGTRLKDCMLIDEPDTRKFLEKFLQAVAPQNRSSILLSLKNPRSPLYDGIVEKFERIVEESLREMRWVPGAVELLESLKERYRLVLVSNLLAYQKNWLFGRLGVRKYFERCLFSCDMNMRKDDILKDIAKTLKADTEDIVYVGRSYEYDIVPAAAAGLSAVRMTGEGHLIFPGKTEQMIDEEFDNIVAGTPRQSDRNLAKPSVLIVIPPFYKLLGSHNNRINLGASHVSAYLTARTLPNKIYHCDFKASESYASRYQMVFNSIEFYKSLETDPSYSEFESFYRKDSREIVLVTCGDVLNPSFDSGNWNSSRKIAKIVRKANPGAFIAAIGPEVGRDCGDFDLVVSGEVENLLDQIVKRKARGFANGTLLAESELNDFPIFNIKDVLPGVSGVSLDTIIWSRGCVGACDFCRVAQINKGRVRRRSVASVIEEVKMRRDILKVKNFYIVDANFTSDKPSVIEFCRRLKDELPDITWRTESRFDTLDEEVLKEMKAAGCTHLKLGLENALHEKHHVRTKRVNIRSAKDWISRIQKSGLKAVVYLMLGGKWFTPDQYRQMYRNTAALGADGYTVSLFNPYPNTPAGISEEEWERRSFIGSHLDIRLIDFWKIPIDIVDSFFSLELKKGREDKNVRKFK